MTAILPIAQGLGIIISYILSSFLDIHGRKAIFVAFSSSRAETKIKLGGSGGFASGVQRQVVFAVPALFREPVGVCDACLAVCTSKVKVLPAFDLPGDLRHYFLGFREVLKIQWPIQNRIMSLLLINYKNYKNLQKYYKHYIYNQN